MVIASFHLLRFSTPDAARQLVRVPLDRRRLRATSGARFAKLLGTGRGTTMATSADLTRWAAFLVWDDDASLQRFIDDDMHPIRGTRAVERYDVALRPIGAHGSWDGIDPIDGARDDAAIEGRAIAVLTRATVRWSRLGAFLRAVPAVDRTLADTDGLLATVGIGEVPVGRQATFSLWRNEAAVQRFAYRQREHVEVIERTRAEGWYGEEWFARFEPLRSSGTWDGVDPLRGSATQG